MRVLVVDDDPGVRHLTDRVLTRRGHDVITAPSVFHAMAMIVDYQAALDVALLDLQLPGMGGLAYADRLQEQFPAARLVFMTGGFAEDAAGRGPVLVKPFSPSNLVLAIEADGAAGRSPTP